ncbi:MAG: O-antigen ligase family protein [Elusimicrobia bacterium]|nr:O-antigen ligase family protein [Elusimicrobiota bacterium]
MNSTPGIKNPLNDFYRRRWPLLVRSGLVLAVWFAACARAADDLWSASILFAWTTLLTCAFGWGRALDGEPVKLPLVLPAILFIAAAALSFYGSFDRNATLFETWIWLFSFLLAFLFVNVVDTAAECEETLTASSLALIPLVLELGAKMSLGSELKKALVLSSVASQLAVVTLLLGAFYAALYYLLRVVERKNARHTLMLLAVFALVHAGLLLFTQRNMLTEAATPLINHNILAGFALCWFFLLWKRAMEKSARIIWMLPCVFILMVERSWWSYVCVLFGLGIYYQDHFAERLRARRREFLAAAVAAAMLVALMIVVKVAQHSPTVLGSSRLYWWVAAGRMFFHRPWTGVGLGGFATAYPFFKAGVVENTTHAHSFPLELIAETGIIGAASASLLAHDYRRLLTGPRGDETNRVARATMAAVLCFSVININLEYFLNKFVLLFFLASLLIGRRVPARKIKPLFLVAACAGLALCASFWLPLLASSRLVLSGRAAQETGKNEEAEKLYKDALSIDPTNADADWALAALKLDEFKRGGRDRTRLESLDYLHDGLKQRRDFFLLRKLSDASAPDATHR